MENLWDFVMKNERTCIIVAIVGIALDVFLSGCAFEPVADTMEPVLYIVPENTHETELDAGQIDTALEAVVIRNSSERRVSFGLPQATFHGVIDTELGRTFVAVRYTDSDAQISSERHELTGSFQYVAFEQMIVLEPGQVIELVLRADIPRGAANRVEVGMGDAGLLLTDARYVDTGDFIADELIVGNQRMTRHVIVR